MPCRKSRWNWLQGSVSFLCDITPQVLMPGCAPLMRSRLSRDEAEIVLGLLAEALGLDFHEMNFKLTQSWRIRRDEKGRRYGWDDDTTQEAEVNPHEPAHQEA